MNSWYGGIAMVSKRSSAIANNRRACSHQSSQFKKKSSCFDSQAVTLLAVAFHGSSRKLEEER